MFQANMILKTMLEKAEQENNPIQVNHLKEDE